MILILMVLVGVTSFSPLVAHDEKCTRPTITKPTNELWEPYLVEKYRKVMVFRCYQYKKITVYNCQDKIVRSTLNITYTDFTNNCLNAFKTKLYVDTFNVSHRVEEINKTMPVYHHKDNCVDGTYRNITTYIRLENFLTTAKLLADEIELNSSSVCSYSLGFCYSNSVWSVWETNSEPSDTDIEKCEFNYIAMNATDKYILTMDKKYVVWENTNKALAYEVRKQLNYCDKTFWSTNKMRVVLFNNDIPENSYSTTDPNFTKFVPKDIFLRTLIENCKDDLKKKHKQDINDENTTIKILTYIVVIIMSCIILYIGLKVITLVKRCLAKRKVPDMRSRVDSITDSIVKVERKANPGIYEYITNEYNINELYTAK